jgi:hypothetical protein
MTRFQLVFRTDEGDRSELRDSSESGEARVNGVVLLDGTIFAHGGREWLVTREDLGGDDLLGHEGARIARFLCTPVESVDASR